MGQTACAPEAATDASDFFHRGDLKDGVIYRFFCHKGGGTTNSENFVTQILRCGRCLPPELCDCKILAAWKFITRRALKNRRSLICLQFIKYYGLINPEHTKIVLTDEPGMKIFIIEISYFAKMTENALNSSLFPGLTPILIWDIVKNRLLFHPLFYSAF